MNRFLLFSFFSKLNIRARPIDISVHRYYPPIPDICIGQYFFLLYFLSYRNKVLYMQLFFLAQVIFYIGSICVFIFLVIKFPVKFTVSLN